MLSYHDLVWPIFKLLCFSLFCGGALYIWALRRNGYWCRRGIPGPTPVPFKGSLDAVFGNNLNAMQIWEWTKQFGRVFGFQYGWYQVLVISESKMVHELLVDKFDQFTGRLLFPEMESGDSPRVNAFLGRGNRWKRLRAILNPIFSKANLKKYKLLMDDSIQHMIDILVKANAKSSDEGMNLMPFFVEMTNDVLQRFAFGQQGSQQFQNNSAQMARRVMEATNSTPSEYYEYQFPWLDTYVFAPYHKYVVHSPAEAQLKRLADMVARRKRKKVEGTDSGREHEDLIDSMLDAESETALHNGNGNSNGGANGANGFNYKRTAAFEKKMTIEEIVSNCFLFSLAGFDTMSNTLSLVCHFLALHPEVQNRVRDEIDSHCDEIPTYEQLGQLKYTEATIKETLRLLPVAQAVVTRVCDQTTTLGDYTVEKGTAVWVDSFTAGRDKEVFGPDVEEFRPERWLETTIPPTAFLAFGGGPRVCIGMRFAYLQMKLALCHLLRTFTLHECEQTEKDLAALKLAGQMVFSPASVTVRLEQRC